MIFSCQSGRRFYRIRISQNTYQTAQDSQQGTRSQSDQGEICNTRIAKRNCYEQFTFISGIYCSSHTSTYVAIVHISTRWGVFVCVYDIELGNNIHRVLIPWYTGQNTSIMTIMHNLLVFGKCRGRVEQQKGEGFSGIMSTHMMSIILHVSCKMIVRLVLQRTCARDDWVVPDLFS